VTKLIVEISEVRGRESMNFRSTQMLETLASGIKVFAIAVRAVTERDQQAAASST
jgi:hypothetical protein